MPDDFDAQRVLPYEPPPPIVVTTYKPPVRREFIGPPNPRYTPSTGPGRNGWDGELTQAEWTECLLERQRQVIEWWEQQQETRDGDRD